MSLLLTLERGPQPQAVRQMRLENGELVIGRSPEADWRIDDPDMYVSRAHCTVAAGPGGFTVTDTSAGGLFVDEASAPLGRGRTTTLRDGMRLRLGDYVLRVELADAEARAAAPPPPEQRAASSFDADDFFSAPVTPPAPNPRPAGLPDPFDAPVSTPRMDQARRAPPPPAFDDPFTLDPAPTPPAETTGIGSFDWDAPGFAAPPPPSAPTPPPTAPLATPPATPVAPPRPSIAGSGDAGRAAFLRGLGLDPDMYPADDPVTEMEAFGRAHRLMLEGLMHLLHKRAEEKSNARLAQTTVSGAAVNPLKFVPTVDDALAVLMNRRSPGFLDEEAAITGAVRDLAQHHVSAWRGVQGALARMLDRFDPAALEAELKELSRIGTLLAGGRRAKLWELYEERYREIAKSAESRFLGEVGADFRDAYEKGD